VNGLTRKHNVQLKNVLNLDQVPWYFEREGKYTLAMKSQKEVKLSTGSTGRKRFTFTPVVSADGEFLSYHALFSKLLNVPKVMNSDQKLTVSVNKSGMWNEVMIKEFVAKRIAAQPQT